MTEYHLDLTDRLFRLLRESGAGLVRAGDLGELLPEGYPVGVSVAIPLPSSLIRDLMTAPNLAYLTAYETLNAELDRIVTEGEHFLERQGYKAYAVTTDRVRIRKDDWVSSFPHKTVAVHAGMGWIGKSDLLVTPEYGSAVRLSSLLTDAPLRTSDPILTSHCGTCTRCVAACPGSALTGAVWTDGMPREELVNVQKCYQSQKQVMLASTGIDTDLCGKCFSVCAYTQRYLTRSEKK